MNVDHICCYTSKPTVSPLPLLTQEKSMADDLTPLPKPSEWNEDIDLVETEVQKPTKPKGRKPKKKENEVGEKLPSSSKDPINRRKAKKAKEAGKAEEIASSSNDAVNRPKKTKQVGEDKKEEKEVKTSRKRKGRGNEESVETDPKDSSEADKTKAAKVAKTDTKAKAKAKAKAGSSKKAKAGESKQSEKGEVEKKRKRGEVGDAEAAGAERGEEDGKPKRRARKKKELSAAEKERKQRMQKKRNRDPVSAVLIRRCTRLLSKKVRVRKKLERKVRRFLPQVLVDASLTSTCVCAHFLSCALCSSMQ